MKKVLIILGMLLIICVGALNLPQDKNTEYDFLRLHIRANSNLQIDQQVKYQIKDVLVEFLTPYFCNAKSKGQAINMVENLSSDIEEKCNEKLLKNGFNYTAKVKINNEYFPTRTYQNTTLESGYYDAVIVELGEAVGDNWWCVMYPPLCFVNKNENEIQIKYKSKIAEIFKEIFK